MGPITLFDKSFLQSLSLNEAVLFDMFFLTNIAPVFFVETLADLEKAVRSGRTPSREVGIIADKTPQMCSAPNMFHATLCFNELIGYEIPLNGRIIRAGGRHVKSKDDTGVVFEVSPEAEAFSRWQDGQFLEVERKFARVWRELLSVQNFEDVLKRLSSLGINPTSCKSLEQAKEIADSMVSGTSARTERFTLAMRLLGVPEHLNEKTFKRWKKIGYPPLAKYAPYVAHVMTVDLFFYIAAAANLFSTKKVTNRVDLAYLYYLPFCMMFVSTDHFHRRCASLFLRPDQEFVWGADLKAALGDLDDYYRRLPESEKERGLYSIASRPPFEDDSLVSQLWDRFLPGWRKPPERDKTMSPEDDKGLLERAKRLARAPDFVPQKGDFDSMEPDFMILKRKVQKKRGDYWQMPKDLRDENGE